MAARVAVTDELSGPHVQVLLRVLHALDERGWGRAVQRRVRIARHREREPTGVGRQKREWCPVLTVRLCPPTAQKLQLCQGGAVRPGSLRATGTAGVEPPGDRAPAPVPPRAACRASTSPRRPGPGFEAGRKSPSVHRFGSRPRSCGNAGRHFCSPSGQSTITGGRSVAGLYAAAFVRLWRSASRTVLT